VALWGARGRSSGGSGVPQTRPRTTYGANPHDGAVVEDRWIDPETMVIFEFIPPGIWVNFGAQVSGMCPGVHYTESESPPLTPNPGDEWFQPSTHIKCTYEQSVWVETN
jgi:hypothetical protein